SIEPPAPRRIGRELDLYCVVADPARNPRGHGVPPRIADDRVVQPARLLVEGKDRRAAQVPVGLLDKQSTGLVARLIQSPPEDRLAGRLFPRHDGAIIASAFAGSGRLCWSILRRQRGDPCTKSTRSSTASGTRRPASSSTARRRTRRSRSTTTSGSSSAPPTPTSYTTSCSSTTWHWSSSGTASGRTRWSSDRATSRS